MDKRFTNILALFVCLGLLLGLTGCTDPGINPVVGSDTTTTTTAGETTTTTTATINTETENAALQIGGDTFTLDGETFEMGASPEKLLAHLGTPNEVKDEPDPADGNIQHFYYYKDIIVVTTVPAGKTETVLSTVYFPTDHYSFDGISVGMTVEEVDEKISTQMTPSKERHIFSTLYGGVAYVYEDGEKDVRWFIFFPEPEEPYVNGEVNILPGSCIRCIKISC